MVSARTRLGLAEVFRVSAAPSFRGPFESSCWRIPMRPLCPFFDSSEQCGTYGEESEGG